MNNDEQNAELSIHQSLQIRTSVEVNILRQEIDYINELNKQDINIDDVELSICQKLDQVEEGFEIKLIERIKDADPNMLLEFETPILSTFVKDNITQID